MDTVAGQESEAACSIGSKIRPNKLTCDFNRFQTTNSRSLKSLFLMHKQSFNLAELLSFRSNTAPGIQFFFQEGV